MRDHREDLTECYHENQTVSGILTVCTDCGEVTGTVSFKYAYENKMIIPTMMSFEEAEILVIANHEKKAVEALLRQANILAGGNDEDNR